MRLAILALALAFVPLTALADWQARIVPESTLAATRGTGTDAISDLLKALGLTGSFAMQRLDLQHDRPGALRLSMLQIQVNLGAIRSASALMSASCTNGACDARLEASVTR